MSRVRQMQSKQVGVFDDIPFDDTCFGKLYDLTQSECQFCANQNFCGAKFFATKLKPAIESQPTTYLDTVTLVEIDRDNLVSLIVGKPKIIALLTIKNKGNCSQELAEAYLSTLLKEYNLTVINNIIRR